MNEVIVSVEDKIKELSERLDLVKNGDKKVFIGDMEKLNYDLAVILERFTR